MRAGRRVRLGAALGAATLLFASGCGVEPDSFSCRKVCDKMTACDPSLGDTGFVSCMGACREVGAGEDYAFCVNSYTCDDAFMANIAKYCKQDPLTEALRRILQESKGR